MNNNEDKRRIDYHTYKNQLLSSYPESIVDIQLVYEGDDFSFKKESGKIIYTHEIKNPFAKDKKSVGGYCVIKNRLGEFIELMNESEILKCKQVAKMKNIWNTWADEMYLKTIIKRATKRFFYDVVKEIDDEDNKDYDLNKLGNVTDSKPVKMFIELVTKKELPDKDKLIEDFKSLSVAEQRVMFKDVRGK